MKKERLVAFTDAVLAIIMTILVLELARPEKPTVQAFWNLRYAFLAYALSFFWLGSLWMGLNRIWEHAEYVDNRTIFWNLVLLFASSFIPYSTDLIAQYFFNPVIQGFYGINVILMTLANVRLHKVLDRPNNGNAELLKATESYRKMLWPDIVIKTCGLLLGVFVWPPFVVISVLVAAVYVLANRKKGLA